MKKEMTVSELKKKLAEMNKKDMEKLLCLLYKNCDEAEKIINLQLLDESYKEQLLIQYKEKMHDIFFPKNLMRIGFSLSLAKSVITEFKKICQDEVCLLDLQLYYVECGTDFTNTFGDINIKFYDSLCSAYHGVVMAVSNHTSDYLYRRFKDRLKTVVYDSSGIGWGFHDYIAEEYFNISWVESENTVE